MSSVLEVPAGAGSPRAANTNAATWAIYSGACIVLFLLSLSALKQEAVHGYPAFGTYWASGRAAIHGLNPYAEYPETFISKIPGEDRGLADLNLNPPCTIPFFQALAHLPPAQFAWAWTMLSLLCFALSAAALLWYQPLMQKRQVLWLLLCAPALDTLRYAQIYGLLLLLSAAALVLSKRRGAAVAIGLLVAVKPTMAFLLLFLWIAGHRQRALRAAAVSIFASAIPLVLYGPRIFQQWLAATHGDLHWKWPSDIALMALLKRAGHPRAGIAVALIVLLGLAHWTWKRKPDFPRASGVGICAGILCAPLAWHTYLLMAAPFFVARRWTAMATLGACLLVIPTHISAGAGSLVYLLALATILASFEKTAAPSAWDGLVRDPVDANLARRNVAGAEKDAECIHRRSLRIGPTHT